MKHTNIGICFGGYCPLHQGHMDVIMRAKKENDICYVIVCGYDNEPRGWEINLNLDQRFEIIKEFFKNDEQIRVRKINDTELGLDESMSDHNWIVWQNKVKEYIDADFPYQKKYCAINQNGQLKQYYTDTPVTWYVAEQFYKVSIEKNNVLEGKVILMDKTNPISGTQIRKNPVKFWNKITEPFKPYLCKNILVIGTASEGKSTLVKDISRYFDIPYAEEYGRTYMEANHLRDQDLTVSDFEAFIIGQTNLSLDKIKESKNGLFISDTDNLVTLMYAQAYVEDDDILLSQKDVDTRLIPLLEKSIKKVKWDHIFILPPSKDFVNDGVRYMKQASMDERTKNFIKLQKLVNKYYPEESKTYLIGTFYENFCEVRDYINKLSEE